MTTYAHRLLGLLGLGVALSGNARRKLESRAGAPG